MLEDQLARALSAHVAATFFERQLYDGSRSAMTSGGGRFGEPSRRAERRVSVAAGHCPQDEAPEAVNKGLLDFAEQLRLGGAP